LCSVSKCIEKFVELKFAVRYYLLEPFTVA
jgi:hypothetical protein